MEQQKSKNNKNCQNVGDTNNENVEMFQEATLRNAATICSPAGDWGLSHLASNFWTIWSVLPRVKHANVHFSFPTRSKVYVFCRLLVCLH